MHIDIERDDDISCLETFVKGLDDHLKSITPRVKTLELNRLMKNCVYWLMKAKCWSELEELKMESISCGSSNLRDFLQILDNLQFIYISSSSWELIPALKCLSGRELKGFHITKNGRKFSNWSKAVLDIEFIATTNSFSVSLCSIINTLLKAVRSDVITEMELTEISRETMAGVHSVLLHCSSLTRLELKRTRLGYDGILYIGSALRKNTALKSVLINDLPQRRFKLKKPGTIHFLTTERVTLPQKTTCTEFLLELNNTLKRNTTLEKINIKSGSFLPLSVGGFGENCRWTGLGPLQQFNLGAVRSGMSPNLRRSFSLSDLTRPQTQRLWIRHFLLHTKPIERVDFERVRKTLFSGPSFTAPDTEVLQSFTGLDPRLKECLEICDLDEYIDTIRKTYWGILMNVAIKCQESLFRVPIP